MSDEAVAAALERVADVLERVEARLAELSERVEPDVPGRIVSYEGPGVASDRPYYAADPRVPVPGFPGSAGKPHPSAVGAGYPPPRSDRLRTDDVALSAAVAGALAGGAAAIIGGS